MAREWFETAEAEGRAFEPQTGLAGLYNIRRVQEERRAAEEGPR